VGLFDGERLVVSRKYRKVHPAQMLKIKLQGNETNGIKSLKAEVLEK
jgi:hypothetical protein